MAEIIRPDFHKKTIISREQTDSNIGPGEQTETPSNFIFGHKMAKYLEESLPGVDFSVLLNLPYEIKDYENQVAELAEWKDKELIDTLACASTMDWQAQTAYYRAIYQEILQRIKSKKIRE